jgi:peptide-methionine (S)-S-oxide reductase
MTPKTPTSAAPATATPTTADQPAQVTAQHAIFGAGCFWGPELRFSKLPGVIDAEVGYTGGRTLNPTYKEVCNDETGHVEVVRVKFDPAKVTYTRLLEEFFAMHDPTQVNRQGPDFGTQYRTAVFTTTPDQADQAKAFVATLAASGKFSKPIATTIEPAPTFYRAEDYHQDYLKKRGIESCGTH